MKADVRHLARLHAVQFLFQGDYNDHTADTEQAFADFIEGLELPGKVARKSEALARAVLEKLDDVDDRLDVLLDTWPLERIGGVERNVLRLAVYEVLFREEVPPIVAVNEAVQLARELSGEDSGAFINGVLQRMLEQSDRPLREASPSPEAKDHG